VDIQKLPDGVNVERQNFNSDGKHAQIRVKLNEQQQNEETRSGENYVLLNALSSSVLPDGKYLYNPASKAIDVQWIQGIGSEKAPAPQAKLMSTVIHGILTQKLPWGLILLGVFLVIVVELLGIRSLSFAVGAYLSIGTTLAIFCGGAVRWLAERGRKTVEGESEVSPGSLYASGLIAAGGIVGLLGVALKGLENWPWFTEKMKGAGMRTQDFVKFPDLFHDHAGLASWIAVAAFTLLGFSLWHFARKPLEEK